uniref:NPH3 domain-containing protein n=1 Tax=Ananas comosus var. bracteatus TaxID=296719 RepID=A0A6V7Q878_ANACO|nr:unnamed protein product [Ananas comosus var. bracteatus]
MKYMKLGTKPDIFYTEEAVRSVLSDVPTDLIIHINNTKYLLHKFPLLLKCGLLQRLCSDTDDEGSHPIPIALHEIPGGEEAFELCAKFCYGIAINVSAHNFVQAISSARLEGHDHDIGGSMEAIGWSENRIVQPCMDSIVEKILIHPSKVTWSYTYTRPGYNKKQHPSVPKDWWTEDVAELDLDLFRSIISTVRSTKTIPPPLIGEALHVYTCKHLPDPLEAHSSTQSSASRAEETLAKQRRILESIVGMIPGEPGSVSCRFLLRLLKVANYAGASASTKAELIRRAGRQLDEAEPTDLLIPLPSDPQSYDVGAAEAVLENFLAQFRRPMAPEENRRLNEAMEKVTKTFDSYLQVVAGVPDLPLAKFIDLVESLPEIARKDHDGIYQAIDTYLKEHSELGKEEKKSLCRMIDCRKLSPEIRAQAVTNDRMPLRTIVQLLFLEHERSGRASGSQGAPLDRTSVDILNTRIAKQESRKAERGSEGHRPRGEPTQHERTASVGMTRSLSVSKQVNEEIADDKSGGMGRKSKTK